MPAGCRSVTAGVDISESRGALAVPTVEANGIRINYETQGEGEPLVLIPYLAADQACYAFQVAEYAKHFTCYTVDLRGAGLSDKPEGDYTTELFADDVAGFMDAVGMGPAHIGGLSLGAATAMWLAAKYPERVRSLSLHSAWPKTDPFLRVVVHSWRTAAQALGNVTEVMIQSIFPWCFTPELYATRPDYIDSLAEFVRGRPMPPLDAFMRQSSAVLNHDATPVLTEIVAPTLITLGRFDLLTSIRFAHSMADAIKDTEMVVFDRSSHAPIYEQVEEFNQRTLAFLTEHGSTVK
jgi:pimeloyl-ACP methyl ester carboxylesterase